MKGGARRTITSDLRSPPSTQVHNEVNGGRTAVVYSKRKREQEQNRLQTVNGGDDAGNEEDEVENEDYEDDDDTSGEVDVQEEGADGGESKGDNEQPKLAEGFFEIEAVRRKRIRKGETQYLIKWRGWAEKFNTWEPVANLDSCADFIEDFEDRKSKSNKKRKRKTTTGPTPQSKKKQKPPHQHSPDPTYSVPPVNINIISEPINIIQEANGTKKVEGVIRASPRLGSKRRKSFAVKRFKQASKLVAQNDEDVVKEIGYEAKGISGNVAVVVTEILKPVDYSTSVVKGVDDVSVSFLVMRSDGEEVVVDNKYLKEHNPLLLINFYEQHLRYNSPSE